MKHATTVRFTLGYSIVYSMVNNTHFQQCFEELGFMQVIYMSFKDHYYRLFYSIVSTPTQLALSFSLDILSSITQLLESKPTTFWTESLPHCTKNIRRD